MEVKLNFPFVYEGREVRSCRVVKRPKVKDRVRAVLWAKGKYGDEGDKVADAISIYLVSELCEFEGKKIPADFLEENLDYEDFARIWEAILLFRTGDNGGRQNTEANNKSPNREEVELQGNKGNET